MITLNDLALQLGMDRSNARKYILKNGYTFDRVRSPENGQMVLCLPDEVATDVITLRSEQGFDTGTESKSGYFYIVQPVPELDPNRLKFGFTTNIDTRMASYYTLCPTAKVVHMWACLWYHEQTAIDVLSHDCVLIGGEVYRANDVDNTVNKAQEFFSMVSGAKDN